MHMAPQFAKAARVVKDIAKFGTVDCVAHGQLCASKGINAYPTVWLYGRNKVCHVSANQRNHGVW